MMRSASRARRSRRRSRASSSSRTLERPRATAQPSGSVVGSNPIRPAVSHSASGSRRSGSEMPEAARARPYAPRPSARSIQSTCRSDAGAGGGGRYGRRAEDGAGRAAGPVCSKSAGLRRVGPPPGIRAARSAAPGPPGARAAVENLRPSAVRPTAGFGGLGAGGAATGCAPMGRGARRTMTIRDMDSSLEAFAPSFRVPPARIAQHRRGAPFFREPHPTVARPP